MAHVDELIIQIRDLEHQARLVYDRRNSDFQSVLDGRRIQFSEQVAALTRSRVGLWRYMRLSSVLSWIVAPVIYAGIVPLALLDAFLTIYQAINFRVYRIARVRRSEFIVLDRTDLPYLNAIERLNCFYCGYANGLIAYGREIAARTEQYFCPIKHARRVLSAHDHYPGFFEYGDADSYRQGLERLRDALAERPPLT